MSKPYRGKILWVDLSSGTCCDETVPDNIYEQFLSGLGLAAAVLYPRIPAGADPLGPQNTLGFVSGLLTGTGSLFTGRWMAVGKSPLTGTWGDANCGGYFSPAIKQCGYDGIFFSGISPQPVSLVVDAAGARLCDASDLWGKDTVETEAALLAQYTNGHKPAVACIGPAGERLSLISGISHDFGRMAARSGLGAVMGSKRLKAVVLGGVHPIQCADMPAMRRLSDRCGRFFRFKYSAPPAGWLPAMGGLMRDLPLAVSLDGLISMMLFQKWGTGGMNQMSVAWGDAPVKNWAGSNRHFSARQTASLNPDRVIDREMRKYHCYSCPLGCGGICSFNGGETHKPEYETVMAFGSLLLHNDLEMIFEINERLNRAGMDSISAGGTVAFALECFERGIFTAHDTQGVNLTWGDPQAILWLVDKMIAREGLGDLLADGACRAAARLDGHYDGQSAIHAGGQEIAMHDPRLDPGYGLHASVEPTPGRHTTGAQTYYDMYRLWTRVKGLPRPALFSSKAEKFRSGKKLIDAAVATSCYTQLYNGAGLCMFGAFLGADRLPIFEWLNAATGWQRTPQEYMEIGRRIQTLRQMFNIRQGIDPRSLKISRRAVGLPPQTEGANRGRTVELDEMMYDYWRAIGWDENSGIPLPETIEALGLEILGEEKVGILDY
jgi:aldehyde:ferredoxin oxidoreductase